MELTRSFVWLVFAAVFTTTAVWTKVRSTRRRRGTTASPRRTSSLPLPPVATGAPLLGILPALLSKGPLQAIRDAHAEMGSVFTVRLLHRKVTFLVGPEVSRHFYQGLDSEISQDEVSQFTIPTFGSGVAFDVDFTTRREQFRFFGDAMKPTKLRTYAGLMVREVEEYFARWGQSGTVDLKQELEALVTLVASRCLFGEEVRAKMLGEVSTHLRDLHDGMRLLTILFPHLPIPPHRRRDRARARLGDIFSQIVSSRKGSSAAAAAESDMLQSLIDSRYKDGRATTDTEVVGMLVSALFAGQHTTSITGTWAGARLLDRANAQHLRAAVQEQERMVARHGDRVDYEVLQQMETLHRCVKETLRLHPPATVLLRHTRRSFAVRTREGKEYEVPEGHTLASPMIVHHQLPYVYSDPERYEPGRFGPGREEGGADGGQAFSYTAFGGGRHACVGEAFAYMQIKVIWSHLLRNFDMEMVSPFPDTDWFVVMPGPKGKVMVSYNRRRI